jgi:hypothetical protein
VLQQVEPDKLDPEYSTMTHVQVQDLNAPVELEGLWVDLAFAYDTNEAGHPTGNYRITNRTAYTPEPWTRVPVIDDALSGNVIPPVAEGEDSLDAALQLIAGLKEVRDEMLVKARHHKTVARHSQALGPSQMINDAEGNAYHTCAQMLTAAVDVWTRRNVEVEDTQAQKG